MEEEVLSRCAKLLKAYRKLIENNPYVSLDEVTEKVSKAAERYMKEINAEFADQMIGNVVFHIMELESKRQ